MMNTSDIFQTPIKQTPINKSTPSPEIKRTHTTRIIKPHAIRSLYPMIASLPTEHEIQVNKTEDLVVHKDQKIVNEFIRLPSPYLLLLHVFHAIECAIKIRKVRSNHSHILWSSIKPSVDLIVGQVVDDSVVQQIEYLFPESFEFRLDSSSLEIEVIRKTLPRHQILGHIADEKQALRDLLTSTHESNSPSSTSVVSTFESRERKCEFERRLICFALQQHAFLFSNWDVKKEGFHIDFLTNLPPVPKKIMLPSSSLKRKHSNDNHLNICKKSRCDIPCMSSITRFEDFEAIYML